jgi:cation:H+ antiporter
MGTSCPELAVSVSDSIACLGNPLAQANVALGNVVGSNIANILLVLGFSAIFTPIIIKKTTLKKEFPILIFVSLVLVIFGIFFGVGTVTGNYAILRWEGIIFVILMIAYLVFLVIDAKRHPVEDENQEEIKDMKLWKAILFVVIGAIGIAAGGEFVVFGAKGLAVTGATAMGINHDLAESLVGLTIVAVGTSLPELVTSTIAAKKGQNDIALGNVIGSNIFNILFVLGIASTVNPLTTGNEIVVDLIVMMSITTLLFALAFTGKLGKKTGILFITIYVLYVTYLILRTVGVFPQL